MSDSMYDKLGDLLNQVLESGEIPLKKASPDSGDAFFDENGSGGDFSGAGGDSAGADGETAGADGEAAGTDGEPARKVHPTLSQQNALDFLGISLDFNYEQAREAYRQRLKYFHPDRRGNNEVLQKVARDKTRQTIEAWKEVSSLFEK